MPDKVIYSRPASMREGMTHYCAGCGHGTVHRLIAELVDELGICHRTIGIAPVGCAVIAYDYFRFDMSEAAHGRAPAVATGIKRALPDRLVFSYQGDGDLASIGMAETIHAANRGEHFTTIFINNTIYGMTGGQMAPTTLVGQTTATSPGGRDQSTTGPPIRICELLSTLESPYYIERTAIDGPAGIRNTKKAIARAFRYQEEQRGYTFVEILCTCPTYMKMDPAAAMQHLATTVGEVFPVRLFRDRGAEE